MKKNPKSSHVGKNNEHQKTKEVKNAKQKISHRHQNVDRIGADGIGLCAGQQPGI